MQLGMIGLGRMGANMVRRLIRNGHHCVVYDRSQQAVNDLVKEKAVGAASLADLVKKMQKPRAVWLMVPAAVVDQSIADILPLLEAGDILIDGGNSYYVDDIRRAKELAPKKIHYVDVGTSGGVWGLERGYCMMIGGEPEVVKHLDPIFVTLAPGIGDDSTHAKPPEEQGHGRKRLSALRPEWRPGTLSRWSTTASSTASWPPTPKGSASCATRTSASINTKWMRRRRRCATRALSIRLGPWRNCRSVAARQCRCVLAARPVGGGTGRRCRSETIRRSRFRFRRRALDDQGGHRRGRAGAGALSRPLSTLQFARRVGLPGQGALGDALPIRRPP